MRVVVEEGGAGDPALPRRARPGCVIVGGVLLGLALLFVMLARPYTDYLWYSLDAGQPQVFTTAYSTRGLLFGVSFVLTVALFAFSFSRALGTSLVYLRVPATIGEVLLSNLLAWIQRHGQNASKIAAVVLGLLFALGFAGEWTTYLLFRNAGSFGMKEPLFGMDVGFYAFTLPWWLAVLQFLSSLLLLCTLATAGIFIGMQAVAKLAKVELNAPAIRIHLSLLLGATFLLFAALTWMKRYEYGLAESAQFTGAGYAAIRKLFWQQMLAGALALTGVLTLANARVWRPYSAPIGGTILSAVVYLIGMVLWPAVTQRIQVEPDKLNVEGPFAARAIKMTRWAYGLDSVDVRFTDVAESPSQADIGASGPTLEAMRLWDPEVLRRTFEVLQGLRPYYQFQDVDVDRYVIGGKTVPVMLAPRDIRLEGLSASARTWVNTRLQYTHGFGAVMSAVNGALPNGRPTYLIRDIPPKTPADIPLAEPRLYYGDFRDGFGNPVDEYALVGTKVKEFDYPVEGGEQTHEWKGGRGVPISSYLRRLAFSFVLSDGNLLVSGNVTSDTRVLFRRSILERCQRMYPFLLFDNDPYIVLHDNRIVWIVDAYTTTDMVPYGSRLRLQSGRMLNYIRNSVKVTVDAYTGETRAFAVQPDEPILKAFRKIYPGLVLDLSEMPTELKAHWRYPEDQFVIQSHQLTQYHVTDPTIFLNNSDAWEMPFERGQTGARMLLQPYFVQMQLPGSSNAEFLLILPFTPRQKVNMSGWLAARCDPQGYGELILVKFPKGSTIPGPEQMESNIMQNEEIANITKLWNTEQSRLVSGNLIVVPLGKSVLYVKPLFLESRANPIPEMERVVLGTGKSVAVGENFQAAFDRLFGAGARAVAPSEPSEPSEPTSEPGTGPGPSEAALRARLSEAIRLLDEADASLRKGDFGRFGELQKKARELLRDLSK